LRDYVLVTLREHGIGKGAVVGIGVTADIGVSIVAIVAEILCSV